jgi:hypothetical protein
MQVMHRMEDAIFANLSVEWIFSALCHPFLYSFDIMRYHAEFMHFLCNVYSI